MMYSALVRSSALALRHVVFSASDLDDMHHDELLDTQFTYLRQFINVYYLLLQNISNNIFKDTSFVFPLYHVHPWKNSLL